MYLDSRSFRDGVNDYIEYTYMMGARVYKDDILSHPTSALGILRLILSPFLILLWTFLYVAWAFIYTLLGILIFLPCLLSQIKFRRSRIRGGTFPK